MVTVEQAEHIILSEVRDYGMEYVSFEDAPGRILAERILADRDLPPCNRVTMDGIAIRYAAYAQGVRSFRIAATQAAGQAPVDITSGDDCIEIMTGCALPQTTDTVIRYEDLMIENGIAAIIADTVRPGQNIHDRSMDKKQGDTVLHAGQVIDPAVISMAASVGVSALPVKKVPSVAIITTGDELVGSTVADPMPHQVRSSNSHTIKAAVQPTGIRCDILHIPDDRNVTMMKVGEYLDKYDVLLLSGGISMGRFDYVPQVLSGLGVEQLFHKVKQRPGKPFWFGRHPSGVLVFAFPGNPVSAFMCLHRYFLPWLRLTLGGGAQPPVYAVLDRDVTFKPELQYFLQVSVVVSPAGMLTAIPCEGNGSGDYANLVDSNAFIELPPAQTIFKQGEAYRIWPFKQIVA